MSRRAAHRPGPTDRPSRRQPATLDFALLPTLSRPELLELWEERFAGEAPPGARRLLLRELAWRDQERRLGGVDAETRRLLNAAIRWATAPGRDGNELFDDDPCAPVTDPDPSVGVAISSLAPSETGPPPVFQRGRGGGRGGGPKPNAPPRIPLKLAPGTRLLREWNGRAHEVLVVEDGRAFRYGGVTYASLTRVATAITGCKRSGPMFFGLVKRPPRIPRPPQLPRPFPPALLCLPSADPGVAHAGARP